MNVRFDKPQQLRSKRNMEVKFFMEQADFDKEIRRTDRVRKARVRAVASRPHHRTTTLTTDGESYERVVALRPGEETEVEFCNDIVSSAKGGGSVEHHPIRRVSLLKRQLAGGWRNVKVRTEKGTAVACIILENPKGKDDACAGRILVRRSDFA